MTQEFFQSGIVDVCSSEGNMKEFIFFILDAHCGTCNDSDPWKTMIFHHSLKTSFEHNNNTWNEKKQYFVGLCEENKDIFKIFII